MSTRRCVVGDTTNTKRAIAIAKAALEFPVDKLVAMAGATDWLWRGKPVTRDDALNALQDLVSMLLDHDGEASSDWTAGFSYEIMRTRPDDGEPQEWWCKIRWGIDGEGSVELEA